MKYEELIPGRWYYGQSDYYWLFKFIRMEDGPYTNKACTPVDGYTTKSGGAWSNIKIIGEGNMEEVYKFFPEEREILENYQIY